MLYSLLQGENMSHMHHARGEARRNQIKKLLPRKTFRISASKIDMSE